jgi:hypothetical protein
MLILEEAAGEDAKTARYAPRVQLGIRRKRRRRGEQRSPLQSLFFLLRGLSVKRCLDVVSTLQLFYNLIRPAMRPQSIGWDLVWASFWFMSRHIICYTHRSILCRHAIIAVNRKYNCYPIPWKAPTEPTAT